MYLIQSQQLTERHRVSSMITYTHIQQRPGILQSGSYICALLINVVIYSIIAQALDPQTFGSYLFAQWLATITLPVIGTGMSNLNSRQVAEVQSRETPRLVAGIFYFLWYRQHRSIFLYSLLYLSIAFTLARYFQVFTPGLLLLAGLSTLPLLLSSVAGTTLRSIRRADLLSLLQLFSTLQTLLFVIIATQIDGKPVEAFLLAFALASTLTLILGIICVICLLPLEQAVQPGIFLKERLAASLDHSWLMFVFDAIIWQRSELLFLAAYQHNAMELGFYALSTIISTEAIGLAPFILTNWFYPVLLRYRPEHRYLNPYDAFVRTSCYMVFLAVPICTILIVFCPALIKYCLGDAYLAIVEPLRILLIAAVFGSIATVSLTHLTAGERFSQRKIKHMQRGLNIGVALLKIILAIPLVIHWGLIGAALASTFTQIVSALVSILLCKKILRRHETE